MAAVLVWLCCGRDSLPLLTAVCWAKASRRRLPSVNSSCVMGKRCTSRFVACSSLRQAELAVAVPERSCVSCADISASRRDAMQAGRMQGL